MGNIAEVLAKNQSKKINRINAETAKQLNSFNENLSVYKANRSSGVAKISVNPIKRCTGAAAISVNLVRHTSRANASGEEDRNSESSQYETDMRKSKRKRLSYKCKKNKKHVRETGKSRQPPEEDELCLYGGSELDGQIKRLIDTPHTANAKRGSNEEGTGSDEDDLIKDIEYDFNSMEETRGSIGSSLSKIFNNVICAEISKEKLVKKLENHPRPKNLDALKVKKCSTEIWNEMLHSKTRSEDLKTQKMKSCN